MTGDRRRTKNEVTKDDSGSRSTLMSGDPVPEAQPQPEHRPAARQHIAVVGIGYWGKNLVRTFDSLGVLRTVCDSARSRLEAAKAGPAVSRCSELEEVLRDPEIKAVP